MKKHTDNKHTRGSTPHNPQHTSVVNPKMNWNHTPSLTPSSVGQGSAGFTILFAVLVASLLLSISLAIFNITLKEVILSSAARESQYAFYAADTGIECALYWDLQGDAFSTSTSHGPIVCNGGNIPNDDLGTDNFGGQGYGYANQFTLLTGVLDDPCAIVTVIRTWDPTESTPDPNDGFERTRIESRGRSSCDLSNPRRVERAILLPEF